MNFIDLFCGCGGIGLAFSEYFNQCKLACDIDKFARKTYEANFGIEPLGDIREFPIGLISQIEGKARAITLAQYLGDVEVITAGFPCQPFSIAGKQKGIEDERGQLIYEVIRLVEKIKPKAIFLENVPNLRKIRKITGRKDYGIYEHGETRSSFFMEILNSFSELGYQWQWEELNAKDFGLPQNRKRLYIVLFRKDLNIPYFKFPEPLNIPTKLADILEKNVDEKYYLSDKLKQSLENHREKHRNKGNGFGYTLVNEDIEHTRTLTARYKADGSEILLYQYRRGIIRESKTGLCPTLTANMGMGGHNVPIITSKDIEVRKLTPRECARLQGFPDSFTFPVSDSQAYKQIGNSVAVPVVQAIAKEIYKCLGGQI
jgi:DNA (cytosine-5)-methyltransferase 1